MVASKYYRCKKEVVQIPEVGQWIELPFIALTAYKH